MLRTFGSYVRKQTKAFGRVRELPWVRKGWQALPCGCCVPENAAAWLVSSGQGFVQLRLQHYECGCCAWRTWVGLPPRSAWRPCCAIEADVGVLARDRNGLDGLMSGLALFSTAC